MIFQFDLYNRKLADPPKRVDAKMRAFLSRNTKTVIMPAIQFNIKAKKQKS